MSMEQLHDLHTAICSCRNCDLCLTRINAVPGEGPYDAKIMIVGEGPGAENDKTGRPFVGRGGQILDKCLSEVGLRREDIFLTNVMKCRVPHNATPSTLLIEKCLPFLKEQIRIVNPAVIVSLGLPAAKCLRKQSSIKLSDIHMQKFFLDGSILLSTFHPSSIRYNKSNRQHILETVQEASRVSVVSKK